MSASDKIREYLEKEKIGFQILEHEAAYSALEIAGAQHVPGRQFVKTVVLTVDGKFVMCVLPAIHKVNLEKVKELFRANEVKLADEKEVSKLFPDYEVGAEPPFPQSGMKLLMDKVLEENNEIAFNGGSHTDMIKIKLKDYIRLAKPVVEEFGVHIQPKAKVK